MVCNKEGALRELEIAEAMAARNDYTGARDKLLEVQYLFPELDNLSQMITACDILCTTYIGIPGCGTDWYWVLKLTPATGDSDIKSQYHKLTTLLEPIKNKFPGTGYALQLIQDAYSVLADGEKRADFDSKRAASWGAYESVNSQEPCVLEYRDKEREATSQSSSRFKRIACETMDGNGSNAVENSEEPPLKRIRDLSGGEIIPVSRVQNATISTGTQVLDGIHVVDKNMKKICAQEASWIYTHTKTRKNGGVERPVDNIKSPVGSGGFCGNSSWCMKPLVHKSPDPDFYKFDNNRKAEVFSVGQIWAVYDQENMPRSYAQINSIGKLPFRLCISWLKPAPVTADERRWCEVGLPVACGFFDLYRNIVTVTGPTMFSHMISRGASVTKPIEIYPKKGEVWAIYLDWNPFDWCSDPKTREGCRFRMVEILTDYSQQAGLRIVYLVKVEGFRSIFQRYTEKGRKLSYQIPASNLFMFSHNVPTYKFLGGEMDRVSDGMLELDPLAIPGSLVRNTTTASDEGNSSDSSSFTDYPLISHCIMSESETESFEPKWSAKDFDSDQVWALYDGPDSMPRRYAVVNKVVSWREVCVTFLEPHPMLDDEICWVEENLPFVCGLFRAGRTTLNLDMSRFSHLVKYEHSLKRSFYGIYPKKGEIWAAYKNWNSKWKQSDYNGYQCRVVEIISDFSLESEMRIASLVEVQGCMTFFQRELYDGFELIRAVSRTEILSFSHQIPAFTVPGIESRGIPNGSWHLEPDALPPKFCN